MSGGNWVDADFSSLKNLHEKFSSSNISKSRIQGSNIINSLFRNCSLKEAEFAGSQVKSCDFSGSDFTEVSITYSALLKNTMSFVVWDRTAFYATQLADIVFDGALKGCSFENCAFSRVTFQNAVLTNTFFKGKSLKRIRFVA